jgi:hypothetical protein
MNELWNWMTGIGRREREREREGKNVQLKCMYGKKNISKKEVW